MKSRSKTPAATAASAHGLAPSERVPDFAGLSLRRAFELARRAALNIEVEGEGYVVAQDPESGAVRSHPTVRLVLSPNLPGLVRQRDADGVHVASFSEPAVGAVGAAQ